MANILPFYPIFPARQHFRFIRSGSIFSGHLNWRNCDFSDFIASDEEGAKANGVLNGKEIDGRASEVNETRA